VRTSRPAKAAVRPASASGRPASAVSQTADQPVPATETEKRGKTIAKPPPAAKKDAWQGPIPEEPEEEPEEPKSNMISIPIDGQVKTMPAGLQRLLLKSHRDSELDVLNCHPTIFIDLSTLISQKPKNQTAKRRRKQNSKIRHRL
jgi:hypothetical protein